jgi:hypothetical protein
MTNSFILTKLNTSTFSLKIHGDGYKYIYKSILKIIKSSNFDYDTNSILISCEKVTLLKSCYLLSHNDCIQLINDISKQIVFLHTMDYGFYGFDLNDILMIDNHFVICSTHYFVPLTDDLIYFHHPIKRPYFSSPEIIELTTLPSEIHYKCVFYSLGVLVVFCLLNNYLLVGNEIKSEEEIDIIISPLKNAKIYWFIKRCLYDDITKRMLLLI